MTTVLYPNIDKDIGMIELVYLKFIESSNGVATRGCKREVPTKLRSPASLICFECGLYTPARNPETMLEVVSLKSTLQNVMWDLRCELKTGESEERRRWDEKQCNKHKTVLGAEKRFGGENDNDHR